MPRVKLIQDKADVASEHHALFDELGALRGRISGPSQIVLHSPAIARPWNEISEYLHGLSIVEPQHAELAVSAAAREYDCGYGVPWLVELTCLTGHYSLLAGIVNAFEVSPAPDAEQLPL